MDQKENSIRALTRTSKMDLDIGDIMTETVATISPRTSIVDAAQIMSRNDISCLVVMDNHEVQGIITETDLLKRTVARDMDFENTLVWQVMSTPIITAQASMSAFEASILMEVENIRRLPIFDNDQLVGIVTQTDIVRLLTSFGMWKNVSNIMSKNIAAVSSNSTTRQAVQAMAEQDISCVMAMDNNELKGIFTERDLLKRIVAPNKSPDKTKLKSVMTSPVHSVGSECSIFSASCMMSRLKVRRLAVIDKGKVAGLITQSDIFGAIKNRFEEEQQENLRVLDESTTAINIIDLEGNVTYVNPAFLQLTGSCDISEFINKPFLPKKYWQNPEQRDELVRKLNKSSFQVQELALLSNGGKAVYVTFFSSRIRNFTGQITGSQIILHDITAQKEVKILKEMEKKIRNKEQLLRGTLESTADGIMVIDAEGTISHVNHRLLEMWDIGHHLCDPIQSREIIHSMREQIIERDLLSENPGHFINVPNQFETVTLHNNAIIECYCCPLADQSGKVVWNFRDITRHIQTQKKLEEAQKQASTAYETTREINRQLENAIEHSNLMAQEAVKANKAKSEFLANMSHEIRTPMNSIIGFAEILSEDSLSETQNEYLDNIRNSGKHLLQLINDILDFSKIEAGRIETEEVEFNLNEIINEIEAIILPQAQDKSIDFDIINNIDSNVQIITDPARLRQCLLNLLGNAIKFTNEGYIKLAISSEKDSEPASEVIKFDVEDTGIGIKKEKLNSIFEPFEQAEKGTSRQFGGTGLGLSITHQLVKLLNGSMDVESEFGKGSHFILKIPVRHELKTSTSDKKKKVMNEYQSRHLNGRILVAEDNPNNRFLIQKVLEKMGHDATIVNDGREAVNEVENGRYDLILMDIQMPNMNGYEATQTLRDKGIEIPVIALTAHAMTGDKEKCINAGCNEYITKPINRSQLSELIDKILKENTVKEQS